MSEDYTLDIDALVARIEANTTPEGDCLFWTGGISGGQPSIRVAGKVTYVRRVTWALDHGTEVDQVSVTCGNRMCVSPLHLTDTLTKVRHERPDAVVDWSFASDPEWMAEFDKAVDRFAGRYGLEPDEVRSEGYLWAASRTNPVAWQAAQNAAKRIASQRDADAERLVSIDTDEEN